MGNKSSKCHTPAAETHYSVRGNAYDAMRWICIGCAAVTGITLLILKFKHFWSYTRPKEQRQITRMLIAPSIWSLVSLGQILDYRIAQYLEPIGEIYQAAYLCSVFLLVRTSSRMVNREY